MEINNLDYLWKQMDLLNLRYYKVTSGFNNALLDHREDDNLTVGDVKAALKNTLENLTGRVIITLSEKSGKDKGNGGSATRKNITYEYVCNKSAASNNQQQQQQINNQGIGIAPPGFISAAEHDLRLLINDMKWQQKLKEEQEKEEDFDPVNLLAIGAVSKYFNIPMNMGTSSDKRGINGVDPKKMTPENEERIKAAINRLLKADSEFIENIELFAKLAEEKPDSYAQAIGILKLQF